MPTLKSIVATVEGEFVMYQVNREQVEGNEFWKRRGRKNELNTKKIENQKRMGIMEETSLIFPALPV